MAKTKQNVNITIDPAVIEQFKKYCKDHDWKVSTKIESMIKETLGIGLVKRKSNEIKNQG